MIECPPLEIEREEIVMGCLEGRVAIVTGAAQGIGAAYARALAKEGAAVVASDVLEARTTVDSISREGGRALALRTDVSDERSVEEMAAGALSAFGRIDILVNNAAIFASLSLKPFEQIPLSEWEAVMNVNVKGLFLCAKAVVPAMTRAGGGKIINISSGTVVNGAAMMLHYVTSKAAVLGFTRSLARELGGRNICVNALSPGLTSSEGVKANPGYAEGVVKGVASQRCFAREQTPEDLVGALVFLASPASDFMTGQNLLVDGGHYMY
jgi:NAD(P)-dependent dehydrogenase (short-subunit alcohol dehydrogenase family)